MNALQTVSIEHSRVKGLRIPCGHDYFSTFCTNEVFTIKPQKRFFFVFFLPKKGITKKNVSGLFVNDVCNSVNDNIILSLKHLILDGLNRL
jgi:hypothetical protein